MPENLPLDRPCARITALFDSMKAEKTTAGLHPEQAALCALRQLVRDTRAGALDRGEVAKLVIAEEKRCGASTEAAEALARDILDGKLVDFAKRDLGAAPHRRRLRTAKPDSYWTAESEARSRELSAWANGKPSALGGLR